MLVLRYNVLSISEVPSEARNFGEGVARTRYTLLSECDSTEQSEGLRRVVGEGCHLDPLTILPHSKKQSMIDS